MSKELSGNSLFKELALGLQAKFSFMFGVFSVFRQLSKFQLNLMPRLNKRALMKRLFLTSGRKTNKKFSTCASLERSKRKPDSRKYQGENQS